MLNKILYFEGFITQFPAAVRDGLILTPDRQEKDGRVASNLTKKWMNVIGCRIHLCN